MITSIRRQFTGAAYKSILWLLVFAFIAGLIVVPGAIRYASTGGPWIIRVNGEDIGYNQYGQEVKEKQQWLASLNAQYGEYATTLLQSMGIEPNPRALAFDQLVRTELVNQFSDSLGIYMSPEFISQQLSNPYVVLQELSGLVPQQAINFQTGEIDTALLKRILQYKGMSIGDFEQKLSKLLSNKLAMDILGSSFYLPMFEKEGAIQQVDASKTFQLLTLPFDTVLEKIKKQPVSDAQLQSFYDQQNQQFKRYWVPEKRSGKIWQFDPKKYQLVISDDEMNKYYESNKTKLFVEKPVTVQVRRILIKVSDEMPQDQAMAKMELIKQELTKDPTRFAALAKEYSTDEKTANNGGLLEPFARGKVDPNLERAAFLLAQDGDISSIFQTKDGLEIIQRVAKTKPIYKPISAVQDEIKKALTKKVFKEQFTKDMRHILSLADAQKEAALQKLVAQKGGTPQVIEQATLDSSPELKALFKVEKDGVTFFVGDEHGVAVKATDSSKSYLPELAAIKSTVLADFQHIRAEQEMRKQLENARAQLKTEPLKAIAQGVGAKVEEVGPVKTSDKEMVSSLERKGIPITQMLQLEKEGAVLTHSSPQAGYLVQLNKMSSAPVEGVSSEKTKELMQRLSNEQMRLFVEGFIASLYRTATIETNESVLTQP